MSTESEPDPTTAAINPSAASPVDPPLRPVLAERYELGTVLGHGGVGTVYLARDVVLDRAVAVKLFRPDAAVSDEGGRYRHEARLLASLSHPGLVTVFDAGIDTSVAEEPKPFLVMELVAGMTLARRLEDGPVPPAETASLGAQLAAALAYVHGRGVVHRDVKPANILLADGADAPRSTAKLTDFGIARLVDSTRMTMHGLTLGTPNYLSPEQATGGAVGAPSDVYALGLVLLECLTGQIVYPGFGVEAAVVRLHRPPSFPPWLGPDWTALLMAMTHPDPVERPSAAQSAHVLSGLSALSVHPPALPAEALAALPTRVLPAAGGSTRMLPAPPRRSARRPARRSWWVAPASMLAAAVVVVVVIANRGSDTPSTVRPPAYPSVPGQLGVHLQELQRAVHQ